MLVCGSDAAASAFSVEQQQQKRLRNRDVRCSSAPKCPFLTWLEDHLHNCNKTLHINIHNIYLYAVYIKKKQHICKLNDACSKSIPEFLAALFTLEPSKPMQVQNSAPIETDPRSSRIWSLKIPPVRAHPSRCPAYCVLHLYLHAVILDTPALHPAPPLAANQPAALSGSPRCVRVLWFLPGTRVAP